MKILYLLENQEQKEKRFWEILYDERLSEGVLYIPAAQYREVGGINCRLKAKRQYELLLRLAEKYFVEIEESPTGPESEEGFIVLQDEADSSDWEGIRTDCYIVSRYKEKLLQNSLFNEVVNSILITAAECKLQERTVNFLEKMLARKEAYYVLDDAVQPVLIYKGEDICYNVLNVFAQKFGEALERRGQRVEFFDVKSEQNEALVRYIGKHYRAVVGMQTYLFSIKMKDGQTYLHDLIHAPVYNFVFDHPIWVKTHMLQSPKKMSVFTLDDHYVRFCEKYYQRKAYLFPPAADTGKGIGDHKQFAISFVGSYGNYWNEVLSIHRMERQKRFIANRFLLKMRLFPNMPSEEAFRQVLDEKGIVYTDQEYLDIFYDYRRVIYCVMHYYRVKVIRTLLEAGLTVDVFGDSWRYSMLAGNPKLVLHTDVTMDESLEIFRRSKLSLNVMSWHKGGFTERMANIMFCKSVLVTDDTAFLDGRFERGKDLLAFKLDALEELPDVLKGYLDDDAKREEMASHGFGKVSNEHIWDNRAREFLDVILEEADVQE